MKHFIFLKKFCSIIISLILIITSLPAELLGSSFLAPPGNCEISKSAGGKNVYILGFGGTGSDSSVVLLKNGKLIQAIQEERLSRQKDDETFVPLRSIKRVLQSEEITMNDIDSITVGWDFNKYWSTDISPPYMRIFYDSLADKYPKKLNSPQTDNDEKRIFKLYSIKNLEKIKKELKSQFNVKKLPEILFMPHHECHAASTYYSSGLEGPVLILIIDGAGEDIAASIWRAEKTNMELIEKIQLPHSLGWVYSAITEYLGFKPKSQESRVMDLAPYGKPKKKYQRQRVEKIEELFDNLLKVNPDGTYEVNINILSYGKRTYGSRFTNEFKRLMEPLVPQRKPNERLKASHKNLAYVLQKRIEKAVLGLVRKYTIEHPRTKGIKKLALAGGVAMNIKVSSEILKSGLIDKLFVMPASSDTGSALGAALLVWKKKYGYDPRFKLEHMYYGTEYSNKEIFHALRGSGLVYSYCRDEKLLDIAVERIVNNDAVCWFQGKMEWGPRALGSRSILLNVKDPQANEKANKIKGRETWRSSAISILPIDFHKYIKTHGVKQAPFMIVGFNVKKPYTRALTSGRHKADGSTRPQTVSKKYNYRYWRLLVKLGAKIGICAVVNTSFNKQGEPIVESPQDAIGTFKRLEDVKYLIIGNYFVSKLSAKSKVVTPVPIIGKTSKLISKAH